GSATQRRKYRWYIADECGDGHWNAVEQEWSIEALDLSPIFEPDDDGTPGYVKRYRPGSRSLISTDSDGKPLKATLEIALGVSSSDPYIADANTGGVTWQTIPHGWRLLDDRLGIELTVEDPENWSTGNPKLGDIRGITWQAAPPSGKEFALRLTAVIEA